MLGILVKYQIRDYRTLEKGVKHVEECVISIIIVTSVLYAKRNKIPLNQIHISLLFGT